MKTNIDKHNIVYTNTEAEAIIQKQLPIITEEIKTNALDLSAKELPKSEDSLAGYIPFLKSKFQLLLEKLHKQLGAKRTKVNAIAVRENYEKEEALLQDSNDALKEDIRILEKQEKNQNSNLKSDIKNWRTALPFLVLLNISEVLINFKIFLPISTNVLTALIGAGGIAISFFIICHVFKDVLAFFPSKIMKWSVGAGIILLITGLLFSFAKMRLAYSTQLDDVATEHISSWNFVAINLTLFLSGIALTMIYKPSKKMFSDYRKHKNIGDQITVKDKEYQTNKKRLGELTAEKNERLDQLDGIILMAHHYEKIVCAEYISAFSRWSNENLIARKDNVRPLAFSETPTPLTTYFDDLEFLTDNNQ